MKRIGLVMPLLLLLICGCVSVDYVGQDFPPLPDGRAVLIFNERNPVPAGMYQSIGRAEVEFPQGYNGIEMREKLSRIAREHGASAVNIVKTEKRLVNTYYAGRNNEDHSMISSRSSTGALVLQSDGARTAVDSFGNQVQGTRTYKKEYRTVVRILVMMPVKDYQRIIDERRKAAEWIPAPSGKTAEKGTDKAADKAVKP